MTTTTTALENKITELQTANAALEATIARHERELGLVAQVINARRDTVRKSMIDRVQDVVQMTDPVARMAGIKAMSDAERREMCRVFEDLLPGICASASDDDRKWIRSLITCPSSPVATFRIDLACDPHLAVAHSELYTPRDAKPITRSGFIEVSEANMRRMPDDPALAALEINGQLLRLSFTDVPILMTTRATNWLMIVDDDLKRRVAAGEVLHTPVGRARDESIYIQSRFHNAGWHS